MPKIVILHRQSDADAMAGRICERLAERYGDGSLFMNMDAIPFGPDYRDHIYTALLNSDAVVVIIGPKWLGSGPRQQASIKDDADSMRIQIGTVLETGLPLVPVLVEGARMPAPAELPDSLKDFADRNAVKIQSGRDFPLHMNRLIRSINLILEFKTARVEAAAAERALTAASNGLFAQTARRYLIRATAAWTRLRTWMRSHVWTPIHAGARSPGWTQALAGTQALASSRLRPWLERLAVLAGEPKRSIRVVAVACAATILLGGTLGLFLFRGPTPVLVPPQASQASKQGGGGTVPPTCSTDSAFALLDDGDAPESGPARQSALKNAVARYFACQSIPIEQFSRAFATLSVVVAQYAPDTACFKGDKEAADQNWAGQKDWADRQGRADLLMTSLTAKIDQIFACVPAEQQRLLFVDFARAFAFAAAGQAMQSFVNPVFRGQRVDHCLSYARECDGPAALAWCQRYGYSRIVKWEWVNIPQTITLADQKSCDGSCGGFTSIVCAR